MTWKKSRLRLGPGGGAASQQSLFLANPLLPPPPRFSRVVSAYFIAFTESSIRSTLVGGTWDFLCHITIFFMFLVCIFFCFLM